MNKKGFEFSFGWLFALLVGAAILTLAIYGAVRLIDMSKYQQQSFAGKELGIILNPVEAGLSSAEINPIKFPVRTRVYSDCESTGNFGKQMISTSIQSGLGDEWEKPSAKSTFYNKYIFSTRPVEGKKMYAFSKPFNFPYKVADVIFLYSADDKFCFVDPPSAIQEELEDFNTGNFNITSSVSKCPSGSKKVCFSAAGCDVNVNLNAQSVRKSSQNVYYTNDEDNTLLYGAIFAEPELYECQVKRLMKRTSELASVYRLKTESLSPRGCGSNMEADLVIFGNKTFAINRSIDLGDAELYAKEIGRRNDALQSCKLF